MRNKFYNQYYKNERNEFRGNTGVYAHLQVEKMLRERWSGARFWRIFSMPISKSR